MMKYISDRMKKKGKKYEKDNKDFVSSYGYIPCVDNFNS